MKSFAPLLLAAGALAAVTVEPTFVTSELPPEHTIEPDLSAIEADEETKPAVTTSNVKGKAFSRFYQIWFENTDFNVTAADPNFQWLASQGILLENYYAITHPSQPNYVSVVGGDQFGLDNDGFMQLPANLSTVADMLDFGGVSWAEYQEGLPYPGYQGFNFSNQKTYANDYMRKHNPLMIFDNISLNNTRNKQIKNFTNMMDDLTKKQLPQWAFITPNMTNDAHDTNVTFAGSWLRSFMEPLMKNDYFMEDTLILVTFDENDQYPIANQVYSVLLGGAVPKSKQGTKDTMYYNHYSAISSVASNWGLPQLGRWDCGANVFGLVADQTGYTNTNISLDGLYFNSTYPGAVSFQKNIDGWWPSPNTLAKCASGKGVLPSIKKTWGSTTGTYNYTNVYPYNSLSDTNTGGKPVIAFNDRSTSSSSTTGSSPSGTSTAAASTTTKGAAGVVSAPAASIVLGLAAVAVLFM